MAVCSLMEQANVMSIWSFYLTTSSRALLSVEQSYRFFVSPLGYWKQISQLVRVISSTMGLLGVLETVAPSAATPRLVRLFRVCAEYIHPISPRKAYQF